MERRENACRDVEIGSGTGHFSIHTINWINVIIRKVCIGDCEIQMKSDRNDIEKQREQIKPWRRLFEKVNIM